MARRSSGKGTTPLSTAIDSQTYAQLVELAGRSGVAVARYARIVIEDAVSRGVVVQKQTVFTVTPTNYNTPDIIALRAAENPIQRTPRRSAGG